MKNTIGKHTGLKNSSAILLLVIFLVCCLTGCGEKKTAEGNGVSIPLCEKLDSHFAVSDNLISLTEADMEEMSFRSISENDFENVGEKDFRNILKGLFRKYSNDYEIYAIDNSDYALVVSWYGGTPSASYWLYKEYGEWHIENVGSSLSAASCGLEKFSWLVFRYQKSRLVSAAVPTLRRCCGVAVFSCKGVVRPLVGARTMYPVFTFLMMITSFCPYE